MPLVDPARRHLHRGAAVVVEQNDVDVGRWPPGRVGRAHRTLEGPGRGRRGPHVHQQDLAALVQAPEEGEGRDLEPRVEGHHRLAVVAQVEGHGAIL